VSLTPLVLAYEMPQGGGAPSAASMQQMLAQADKDLAILNWKQMLRTLEM
jgi:hypothetical protein